MTELKAKSRTQLGRGVKPLRREGLLPAVVYGEKVPSQPISVSYKEFSKVYAEAGESTLVELDIDGKKLNVLINDTVRDPLREEFLHADFYAVRMDKVIRKKVHLAFTGESPAVKNEGGILVKVMQEAEVEALPRDLPHELKVDISLLKTLESKFTLGDLVLPAGVKIIGEVNETLVLVEKPRSVEELEALVKAPEGVEPIAEVKTEQEEKREAKEKEKAETTETGKEAGGK